MDGNGGPDAEQPRRLERRPAPSWPRRPSSSMVFARMQLTLRVLVVAVGLVPASRALALAQDPAPVANPDGPSTSASPTSPAPAPSPVGQDAGKRAPKARAMELSLDAAREIALKNNLGLKIETLNSEVALYNYRASWGAFDWALQARASYTDAEFQPRDIFGGSTEKTKQLSVDFTRPLAATGGTFKAHVDTTNTETNSAFQVAPRSTTDVISLNYTQPLLRGAWREYATSQQRQSELDSRRQDEVLRAARQKLVLDVTLAYWNLVAARDALGVAESSLELARRQVDQNQRRLDAGLGTPVEVLQAEAEVATREESRLNAEVAVSQAADQLKQLLIPGTDVESWETSLVPSTPLPEVSDAAQVPDWDRALSIAIERRSDLRQQRLRVDTAAVLHERSRSERKPGLDLDLTASSQGFSSSDGRALETTAQFDYPRYQAALTFNYALGNTSARNLERAAWASLRAARLSYDDLESKVAAEVREAVRQVRYQSEAVRAADKSLELARRQLEAEQSRFDNQISTVFQVLQFQVDLTEAMSRARSARAGYARALANLASAQGLLGEARSGEAVPGETPRPAEKP